MKEISYQTILVTTDGSDLASAAFPHAVLLAKNFNAHVLLFSVSEVVGQAMAAGPSTNLTAPVAMTQTTAVAISEFNRKGAKEYLEKVKQQFEDAGARAVETEVSEGIPEEEIVDAAKNVKADLIIMATHGSSGIERALLGSVTDYVVRYASCPVLIVHPLKKGG